MKKLYKFIALIVITAINAQAPQGFNYQATVRNSSGALIINQNVTFKFNIMLNSQTSLPVYSETHQAPTDDLGQVNLTVGTGTATIGTFAGINWGSGTYYLGIELNTGANFVAMGTTQLLSVPYALYANTAGSTSSNNTGLISPTITTNPVTNITGTSAFFSATISNVNTNQLSTRAGFVYSINPNPIYDFASSNSSNDLGVNLSSNTFTFDSAFQGWPIFLPNVLYYTRAFVFTENNTIAYGNEVTFTTQNVPASLPSVTIGTQVWQNTNLNVFNYRDGTPIPQVTDPTQWANLTTGAWCFGDSSDYGILYNWYAVAGIYDSASLNDPTLRKQLAPLGWHVPSDLEWSTLINYLDPNANGGMNNNVSGGKMKTTGNIDLGTGLWWTPNIGATNETGFSGIPGGQRSNIGEIIQGGTYGWWWSSSQFNNNSNFAFIRILGYDTSSAGRTIEDSKTGNSVRCVKD